MIDEQPTAVFTREQASELSRRLRQAGRTLVFTNGCFDLLHVGHVRYLDAARRLGDALIVGLNTDASVAEVKGPGRPVLPEAERAELLAALACVDGVTLFAEPTPRELIEALEPQVLVKGADWAADAIVGRDLVEGWGGRVVRMPLVEGRSTSELLAAIRAGHRLGVRK